MGGIFDMVGTLTGVGQSSAPAPRNLGGEIQSVLDQAPALYKSQAEYAPKYNLLALNNLNTTLNGSGGTRGYLDLFTNDILPAITRGQNAANTATRTANLNDLQTLAPGVVNAIKSANPEMASIYDKLAQQAGEGLDAGSALTADQQRQVNGSVRAGQGARGMAYGPASAYEEVLANSNFGNQLQQQRQAQAGNVAEMGNNMYSMPALQMLSQTGNTGGAYNFLSGTTSAANAAGAQGDIWSQMQQYASGLNEQNYAGKLNTGLQNASNYMNMWLGTGKQMTQDAGTMSSMFSSGMFCWAAREIFGTDDGRWLKFRSWMLNEAPEKFRKFYMNHGRDWAARLKNASPATRAAVERWMMKRIEVAYE